MAELSKTIVMVVLMVLVLGIGSERMVLTKRDNSLGGTEIDIIEGLELEKFTDDDDNRWPRAHFGCRLSNGTTLQVGHRFMHRSCYLCQCQRTGRIICTKLRCAPVSCMDSSKPITKPGECCPQCPPDPPARSCLVDNVRVPHGTVVRTSRHNFQCWCQLGVVECRGLITSPSSGSNVFRNNSAAYIVGVILLAILLVVTLLCCGFGFLYYYYYYYSTNQQLADQANEQYWNSGGWQPMADEEYVAAGTAEEKQAEAEQNQSEEVYPTGSSEEYIPPPYAIYNASYVTEEGEGGQKHI